jgi:hypothetical protein
MSRSIFEEVIDQWPQDRPDIRVNWPRVALALVPAAMMLLALGFKGGQSISVTSLAAAKAPSVPEAESTLQLVAEPWSQGTDSRSPVVPLSIFVNGPKELASAATVEVIGLPSGSMLSAGRSVGDRWRIPATRLSGAVILPPKHFSGAVDLEVELRLADDTLVERRSVRRAMTDPDPVTEEAVLPLRKAEPDRSGARLVRAAEAGNAQVALLIGKATDLLAHGDVSTARLMLQRAADLGSAEARQWLNRLASEEPGGDRPVR